jgi:hypothetical protein
MASIRTLAMAFIAVLALSALGISTASAAQFTSTSSPVTMFGKQGASQGHKFTIEGNNASCQEVKFESGSTATPTPTVALGLTYTNKKCENFKFTKEQSYIEPNGCKFELLQPNISLEGNVAIRCASGKSIKIVGANFSVCEVLIGESGNTNLAKAVYTPLGAGKFEVNFNLTGITAEKKEDFLTCELNGVGIVTTATFSGKVTIEGLSGIGLSID